MGVDQHLPDLDRSADSQVAALRRAAAEMRAAVDPDHVARVAVEGARDWRDLSRGRGEVVA